MSGSLLALLALLLLLSGAFSGSETALFSLAPRDRARAGQAARDLLGDPSGLLVTVLFGNLVVNLLFFLLSRRLFGGGGRLGGALTGLLALVAILIVGEIVPKALSLRAPVVVARAAAPPLVVLVRVLAPVRRAAKALLRVAYRALGPHAREEEPLTPEDLAAVLEHSALAGQVGESEAELAAEILELREIRVREIMRPRVDLLFLERARRDPAVVAKALAAREAELLVCEGSPDRVVGRVRLTELLRHPERSPGELIEPVVFVPEVAGALDLLVQLRESGTDLAVVVDEWGGTAGAVTIEDVFEEIVGDLRAEGEERPRPVVPLGEGRYRVSGQISIRDWNELFGRRVVPREFETLGGFVTALLGRIPRHGDLVVSGGLEFQVQETRGRRVVTVDVRVGAGGAAP